MADNIFDLSKLAGSTNDIETKTSTSLDHESNLVGYEPVNFTDWKNIPQNSYIRYLRKDGSFRRGGIVQNVWSHIDKTGAEVIKIDISATFNSQATKWSITSNSVEKIWIKRPVGQVNHTMMQGLAEISELSDDINFCKDSIKQITKEIQKIQNDQIRITNIVKKMIESKKNKI